MFNRIKAFLFLNAVNTGLVRIVIYTHRAFIRKIGHRQAAFIPMVCLCIGESNICSHLERSRFRAICHTRSRWYICFNVFSPFLDTVKMQNLTKIKINAVQYYIKFFCWLGHHKMSFCYPSSYEWSKEVVYSLLRYSMICVMTSPL